MKLIKKLINLFKRSSPLIKPYPTCYNCKHSIYGAGPEGCKIHGDIPLAGSSACPEHEYYN